MPTRQGGSFCKKKLNLQPETAGGGLQHDKVRRRTNTTPARSGKKLAPLREHSVQL